MIHVILLILKILGIILLIILGLLLFILYSVLFVAASYRIRLERHGSVRISAFSGWLFRVVTVRFFIDEGEGWKQDLQIRLFGIPLQKLFGAKLRRKKKRRKRRSKEKKRTGKERSDVPDTALEQPKPEEPGEDTEERASDIEKDDSFFRKVIYAIRGICDKIKRIWKRVLGVRDTARGLWERKDVFLEFWRLDEHRRARASVWKEVRYLWKKLRPKRIEGKIVFGFDDPSMTGICMGGIGMLCAWYPDRLEITPDFERAVLDGDVLIKGKVRLYVLARILWRVYFNQDIRHMYEHWKQL